MNVLRCSQDEPEMILNLTLLLKPYRLLGRRAAGGVLLCALLLGGAPHAQTQGVSSVSAADIGITDAREALRKKDRGRLAAARTAANAVSHPLAMWVDYWELSNRLGEVQQAEVKTSIVQPGGQPIAVNYTLEKQADATWKVYDIVIDMRTSHVIVIEAEKLKALVP